MVWKPGSKHSDPSSRVIARRNDWNSICVLHQGPRSMAASRGRIHDRSPIACRNTKKTLAERGPSIHDEWDYFLPYICAVSCSIAFATSRHCDSQLLGKRKMRSAPSTRRSLRHMPGVAASRLQRADSGGLVPKNMSSLL